MYEGKGYLTQSQARKYLAVGYAQIYEWIEQKTNAIHNKGNNKRYKADSKILFVLTLIGIAMIIDFATGTFASKINKEIKLESNKGINGVVDVSHVYKDYLSGSNNKKVHIPKTSSFDESITNYQVAAGMFSDKDKATEMLDKLKETGINGFKIIETDKEISLDSPRFGYIGNYEVDVDSVFVRAKPEDNAEKIGIIYKGSKYSMSDKIGAWLEFKYREGYVSADFMEEIE